MERFSYALDERIKEITIKDDQIRQLENDILIVKSEFSYDQKIADMDKEKAKFIAELQASKNTIIDLKVHLIFSSFTIFILKKITEKIVIQSTALKEENK